MKKFIKNISLFLFLFILLLVGIFYINNGSFTIDFRRFIESFFIKKVEYFSDFIDKGDSINLILGSSLVEDSIIPDSLGTKWFSFTNEAQNIYESYKFINYYKDSVKIDTIIIGIQPFDFPISYVKNRNNNKPHLNGNFHIFGRDSITILKEKFLLRNLQVIKRENYLKIEKIITKIKSSNREDAMTRQGFSGRIYSKPIDLDSLYLNDPIKFKNHKKYYVNIKTPPNIFYFDLFNSLTQSLDIDVIYLITPKSKYYLSGMKEMNYDKIWNDILDSLETKPIELWDYESMITDTFDFHYYFEETHSSYNGAKAFTKIIKNRLLK